MRTSFALALAVCFAGIADAAEIVVKKRSRIEEAGSGWVAIEKQEAWQPGQTAIIVCDMWDSHHCLNAVRRVEELAPVMNRVLEKARSQGVSIIHAPSSCMEPYKDHPARKRAQAAPRASNLPTDIAEWCRKIPDEEKAK